MRYLIVLLLTFLTFDLHAVAKLDDADDTNPMDCEFALTDQALGFGHYIAADRLSRIDQPDVFATTLRGPTAEALKLFGIVPGQPQGVSFSLVQNEPGKFSLELMKARKRLFKIPLQGDPFLIWRQMLVGEFQDATVRREKLAFDYHKFQKENYAGYSYGNRTPEDQNKISRFVNIVHLNPKSIRIVIGLDVPCAILDQYMTDDIVPIYLLKMQKNPVYYCRFGVFAARFNLSKFPAGKLIIPPPSPAPTK